MSTLIHKHVRHVTEQSRNYFAKCEYKCGFTVTHPRCPQHNPDTYADCMARHASDGMVNGQWPLDINDHIAAERCAACGEYSDYCTGHGAISDPDGYSILVVHGRGNHSRCHVWSDCMEY